MSKLSKTQSSILIDAAVRPDGATCRPKRLNKAAASKVGTSLVARKLVREVRAKPGMPIWRTDGNRTLSLVLTREGRKVIADFAESTHAGTIAGSAAEKQAGGSSPGPEKTASSLESPSPRVGSKQAMMIDMLSAAGGTTVDELAKTMGWLPHTTRAALTGLRKKGFAIVRHPREDGPSIYRFGAKPVAVAA